MVQKTARSSNLSFEGSITEQVSTDEELKTKQYVK